jgi:hypothetical protein
MKDKKEKYYDYIVADLMKKTIIDDEDINLPFGESIPMSDYTGGYYNPYRHLPNVFKQSYEDFSEYVIERYGVMVYETVFLFDRYRRNLIYKISGNW